VAKLEGPVGNLARVLYTEGVEGLMKILDVSEQAAKRDDE
jgi:hypothetical protein